MASQLSARVTRSPDITNRKRAEVLRESQREVLEMIATGAPFPQILRRICASMETFDVDAKCAVMQFDVGTRRAASAISPSVPSRFLTIMRDTLLVSGGGACSAALRSGETVICADIERDPEWRSLREVAAAIEHARSETQQKEHCARLELAFSHSVADGLRGLLRAIAGFAGLLRDCHYETIDADGRRYIDRVLAGTQRMSNLIDDVLELGRITRVEIRRRQVDLSDHGQTILGRLRAAAAERVQDNGVGFDRRCAANLFGAFQRLHAAGEFSRIGLGLAAAQRIVQRHGGRIWADAGVDRGATIYFTIAKGQQ